MRNIFLIALNTFRENLRNKILSLIIIFGIAFIFLSLALARLTIGEGEKIIVDFGIAMIEIFWLLTVVFVGSQLLFKEIEGKTIFLILSKPIYRYEFILGKFFWFCTVIASVVFFQALIYLWILWYQNIPFDMLIIMSLVFILGKFFLLIGIVLFFSTFMSSVGTIFVSVMVYFISHNFSLMIDLAQKTKNTYIISWAYIFQGLFPPYQAMNFKDRIGTLVFPSLQEYALVWLHAILFLFLVLLFTVLIFEKKDFES